MDNVGGMVDRTDKLGKTGKSGNMDKNKGNSDVFFFCGVFFHNCHNNLHNHHRNGHNQIAWGVPPFKFVLTYANDP